MEGMEQYLQEKERKHLEYQRTDWEIEESKLRVDDYFEWEEQATADKSVYQAFDEFMEKENILENDTDTFYGGAFQDFHKQWQGIEEESKVEESVDYTKFSMKDVQSFFHRLQIIRWRNLNSIKSVWGTIRKS